MTLPQQIITIALCALGTQLTRFLPFLIFNEHKKNTAFRAISRQSPARRNFLHADNLLLEKHLVYTRQSQLAGTDWHRCYSWSAPLEAQHAPVYRRRYDRVYAFDPVCFLNTQVKGRRRCRYTLTRQIASRLRKSMANS